MKRTKYLVVEDYTSQYNIPIRLSKGDVVNVGDRYTENPEWPGWIWCENSRGEKGWVLERVLKIEYDRGVVLEDYDAAELNAKKGEVVELERTEGGWILALNSDGKNGWLPVKNVKLFSGD